MNVYDQLHAAVRPLLKHYETDLEKHDKRDLAYHAGVQFLHWTHYSGTTLVIMPPHDSQEWPKYGERVPYLFGTANREHILAQVVEMAKYHVRPCNAPTGYVCHWYDGAKLRQITTDKAVDVAREYTRSIDSAWRKVAGAA